MIIFPCCVSLGSNQGDSISILKDVLYQFKRDKIFEVHLLSSLYLTEPVDTFPQPYFFNVVISGKTTSEPFALLSYFKAIEKAFGRKRNRDKGERTIDIDILFYDTLIIKSIFLTIPHPSLMTRRCVLIPLKEILPYFHHPETKMSISRILFSIGRKGEVIKLGSLFPEVNY